MVTKKENSATSGNKAIRILIVDDHAVVRCGIRQFLANAGGFELAGEATNGKEALKLVNAQDWDLMLLDLGLPDLNGIEVLKRIRQDKPNLPVLVFSMFREEDYAISVLEAGAAGYLPKDSPPEEILTAIRRASCGERYLSQQLAERLLHKSVGIGRKLPHETLSARELEVMLLLSKGIPLKEIAERLFLSPKTVSTYRARVLEKLNLEHNTEITRYVLKHQLEL